MGRFNAYRRAGRIISPDLATSYSEHLAARIEDAEDFEEALIDAHTDIAALGLIDAVKVRLEQAAEALANNWLNEHQAAIALLTDKRRDAYREISELSATPFDVRPAKPSSRLQPTKARENGTETDLPTYGKHLLCDQSGQFPDILNEWEVKVQSVEMANKGRIGWYRNPPRTAPESLGIVYDYAGNTEIMRPDFLFFSKSDDGEIVADIIDPHGEHFAESLPKLRGLADYTDKHGALYRRIEAVAKLDGSYRVLDLKRAEVREMVRRMTTAKEAYLDLLSVSCGH